MGKISVRLSRILGERRISMVELVAKSGVSRTAIHKLYNEKSNGVTWDVLNRLCNALDCQPGDLLEFIPDENPKV